MENILSFPKVKWHLGKGRSWVLLLCFSSFGVMATRQWHDLRRSDRYLNISLISKSVADYSARRPPTLVAQVGLGVIRDMVRDSRPELADLPARLASVDALLHTSIQPEPPLPALTTQPGNALPAIAMPALTELAEQPSRDNDRTQLPTELASTGRVPDSMPKTSPTANQGRDSQNAGASKADKTDKGDKIDKVDKVDKNNKTDKSGHSDQSGEADQAGHVDKSDKSDKSDKTNKG